MSSSTKFSPTAAVRNSCRQWMDECPLKQTLLQSCREKWKVSIDSTALDRFATEITQSILTNQSLEVTEWDTDGWHYTGSNYQKGRVGCGSEEYELMRMERVALYILTLDAIHFCFWPLSSNTAGQCDDGAKYSKNGLEYEHLAIALRKIAEADDAENIPEDKVGDIICAAPTYALSPANLAALTPTKLTALLHPHFPPSSEDLRYELPNIEVRCKLLNELGNSLLEKYDGSASRMIAKANRSADALVGIILDTFPGFRDYVDTNEWNDNTSSPKCDWESSKTSPDVIHFYKRAQIAVSDIWAALGRNVPTSTSKNTKLRICHFNDMELVTTFPDYRVPQILRHVGVLQYESKLATWVDDQEELDHSYIDEVSIRAGTVVAVEELVQKIKEKISIIVGENKSDRSESELERLVEDVSAVTVDWYLWQKGEQMDRLNQLEPHHRVRTTFY